MQTNARTSASDEAAVTGKDVAVLLGLPALFALAWIVPRRLWPRLCATMAFFYMHFTNSGRRDELIQRIRALVGSRPLALAVEATPAAVAVADLRLLLAQFRLYRPFTVKPDFEIEGLEHLDEAIARSKGAILWVGNFVAGSLFAKMALHKAGIRITHLSHPRHGFSESRFGTNILNPIRTHMEARHLDRRVVMNPANPIVAMLELHKRLADNAIVSITVRDYTSKPLALPFLSGWHRLAPGAPEIARMTGAALLPVFAIEEGPDRFRIRIESPIDVSPDRPRADAVNAAMETYLRRLEPYVLNYPDQWLGWPFTGDHAR